MVLNESKAEKILGVVFTVLGVLLLAVIIPTQIAYVKNAYPQPRFFPNIIAGLMTVLGIVLFASGWRKGKAPKQEDEETYSLGKKETRLVLLTLGIVILYVIILHPLYSRHDGFPGRAHHSLWAAQQAEDHSAVGAPAYHHLRRLHLRASAAHALKEENVWTH